jgi:hypothetical protein
MKKLLVITISAALMITLTAGVFAESLRGRDLVNRAAKTTVSGTLAYQDGEWYLKSGGDLILIHFGNQAYLDSIGLEPAAGDEATLLGYLQGRDITPVTVTLGSGEYRLRDESGFPLWAGAGQRRNALEGGRRGALGAGLRSCDCSEEG